MSREEFREHVCERDGYECIVPWCQKEVTPDPDGPGEQHHILDKELWPGDGYIVDNGVNVCNPHHRMSERNEIPPQSHWRWIGLDEVPVPNDQGSIIWNMINGKDDIIAMDKWGESFKTPPHSELREYPKYPSSRHLLPLYWQSERGTAEQRTGRDDTGLTSVESFLDIPLVATIKMDGSNTMLVKDGEEPVRARNGRDAEHESFDHLKQEYWDRNVYENLPEHLQVFGENMYAKHSIHYGCSEGSSGSEEIGADSTESATFCGCCDERNQGPPVDDVFLVFGVYDTRYDLWLSWPETEQVAEMIGFPTVPGAGGHRLDEIGCYSVQDYYAGQYEEKHELVEYLLNRGERTVNQGHEGIIVRSMYPMHYGQFDRKLAKFVRPNHVQTDEHWSHQETVRNDVQ